MNPVAYIESPVLAGIFRELGIGRTVLIYRDSDAKGWTVDKPAPPSFGVERLHDENEGGFYYSVRYLGGNINGMEWDTAKTLRDLRRLIRNAKIAPRSARAQKHATMFESLDSLELHIARRFSAHPETAAHIGQRLADAGLIADGVGGSFWVDLALPEVATIAADVMGGR
jgi:hypothetical protein